MGPITDEKIEKLHSTVDPDPCAEVTNFRLPFLLPATAQFFWKETMRF